VRAANAAFVESCALIRVGVAESCVNVRPWFAESWIEVVDLGVSLTRIHDSTEGRVAAASV
jgi:hypothetical protein